MSERTIEGEELRPTDLHTPQPRVPTSNELAAKTARRNRCAWLVRQGYASDAVLDEIERQATERMRR